MLLSLASLCSRATRENQRDALLLSLRFPQTRTLVQPLVTLEQESLRFDGRQIDAALGKLAAGMPRAASRDLCVTLSVLSDICEALALDWYDCVHIAWHDCAILAVQPVYCASRHHLAAYDGCSVSLKIEEFQSHLSRILAAGTAPIPKNVAHATRTQLRLRSSTPTFAWQFLSAVNVNLATTFVGTTVLVVGALGFLGTAYLRQRRMKTNL